MPKSKGKEIKMGQLGLFTEEEVRESEPEPKTSVRLGTRSAQPKLVKRRRETLKKLIAVLEQLEGKDILVSWDGGSRGNWWLHDLRLSKIHLEKPWWWKDVPLGDNLPVTIQICGNRNAHIRIDTKLLYDVRDQSTDKTGYWLIDFWNGFSQYPIEKYRPYGYESLVIRTT